jgi:DNA-binding response OmpR family regulator
MPVILVVDDNPQMAQLIQEMVELAGFETEVAFSGLDGLDKVREGMPDLILVDVMMPKMDGWQVYQKLREFSSIPVIFVTAYDTPENQIRALKIGAHGYISKDQAPMQLVQQIQFVLESVYTPSAKDYLH